MSRYPYPSPRNECTPVSALIPEVPRYVDPDITLGTLAAIYEGGCASGAYMPAVTYWLALETMAEHGDDVLLAWEEAMGTIPPLILGQSWSGYAVDLLSTAVDLWAVVTWEYIMDEYPEVLED